MTTAPRGDQIASAVGMLLAHVIIPAGIIGMGASLLWYLVEVRAVFLPGGGALKWLGTCFLVASVLIVRYWRVHGNRLRQLSYLVLLGAVTVFAISQLSHRAVVGDTETSALARELVALLTLGVAWYLSAAIANQLSFEDAPVDEDERPFYEYGDGYRAWQAEQAERSAELDPEQRDALEARERAERRERLEGEKKSSWHERPILRPVFGLPAADEMKNATRGVLRLALMALAIFAIGELTLLAGEPWIGTRAFAWMIVCLACTGVVLAAGSIVGTMQHVLANGGRVQVGIAGYRTAVGAGLVLAVLVAGLALPGLRWAGSGELSQRGDLALNVDHEDGHEGRGRDVSDRTDEEDEVPEEAEGRKRSGGSGGETGSWLQAFTGSSLGALISKIAAVVVILAVVVVNLRVLWRAWRGGLVRDWWAGLQRARRVARPSRRGPNPLLGREALAGLEPQAAVEEAYARLLRYADWLGSPKDPQATPHEFLRSLPVPLRPAAEAIAKLTQVYVLSAYTQLPTRAEDRATALELLDEVERRLQAA